MTTPDLERRIRTWFAEEIGEAEAAPASVHAFLGAIPQSVPREQGLFGRRAFVLLAAAVLLVGLLAGAIAVGSGLLKLPSILLPDPSPSVQASAPASPEQQVGVVAYRQSDRIWVVNADGTDARQLVPIELDPVRLRYLDMPDMQYPLAWSPDGSRLYYLYERVESAGPSDGIGTPHSGLAITDAAGSAPVELLDVVGSLRSGGWCPTEADNCATGRDEAMSLSPDGTRLAYTIEEGTDRNISTIVVLDVASGQVTRLQSTRTQNPGVGPNEAPESCSTAHGGYNGVPQWSPDGTRLVFTRSGCQNAVLAVSADGSDLRELVSLVQFRTIVHPRWSPDGSRILFNWPTSWDSFEAHGVEIVTVSPDKSGVVALTSNGGSAWPYWTRDGRIVFVRWTAPADGRGDLWIMDGDGGNATQIDTTVPALTAVGCNVCPRPIDASRWFSTQLGRLDEWLWQPQPL